MKTWEMIKALAENHMLQFENLRFGGVAGYNENGTLSWIRNTEKNGKAFTIHCIQGSSEIKGNWNDDWKLVPQEVTWQEAIFAWVDGKRIRCEHDGEEFKYHINGSMTISKIELRRGKWYIE